MGHFYGVTLAGGGSKQNGRFGNRRVWDILVVHPGIH